MSNYICKLNENVERIHVRYHNRYGIALAGDLYTMKNMDKTGKHPAVVVGAPYGGVKEQGPSVYANELASRGFVVLTFDPCYMGESGGEPRHVSSPDLFSENISAGVDYLGLLPYVDREKIAALGICGSGGFSLSAAAMDTRIKAVITASMYDMSVAARIGQTPEQIQERKEQLSLRRWKDAENGEPEYIPSFPEEAVLEIPDEMQGIWREFFEFYATSASLKAKGKQPPSLGLMCFSNMVWYFTHVDSLKRFLPDSNHSSQKNANRFRESNFGAGFPLSIAALARVTFSLASL